MDSVFDPAEHKAFINYIIANKKHFDNIEAQYMASKADGKQQGIFIAALHSPFISNHIYL